MNQSNSICSTLINQKEQILRSVEEKVFRAFPDVEQRFGREGVERTGEDLGYHLEYLATAVCMGDRELFSDYVAWLKVFFTSINLPGEYILPPLEMLKQSVEEVMDPDHAPAVAAYIDHTVRKYEEFPAVQNSFLQGDHQLNVLAQQYLNSLLRKDRVRAEALVKEAVEKGTPVKDIYLSVFQPVQWEVGRLWQHNKISVAMEHFITAATQFIMSRLYDHVFAADRIGRTMVATSVSGELHELGIRMVSDLFELEGWDTYYLGANSPHASILQMIRDTGPELLAVSATIPYHLPKVEELIGMVRREIRENTPRIIVGGMPFNARRDTWKKVGADGFAVDAAEAIEKVNYLTKN